MSRKNNSINRELKTFEENKKKNAEQEVVPKIRFTPQDLVRIQPLTKNQEVFFKSYDLKISGHENQSERDINILCKGVAGTGKTMISLYKALEEVIDKKEKEKIIIIRSVVETRQRGFLPGTAEEKEAPFEMPYVGLCDQLINYQWRNYEKLKKAGIIEFESTSNLRGATLNDAVIIVDECQNMNLHELDTVITRVGKNSRIIFCGDFNQSDLLTNRSDVSGLPEFERILTKMDSFRIISFGVDDVVRSGLVKEYILAKVQIEDEMKLAKIKLENEIKAATKK